MSRLDPLEILSGAYERIKADQVQGSCTVCVLLLDGVTRLIRGVNLGDSGFILIRDGAVVYVLKCDPW